MRRFRIAAEILRSESEFSRAPIREPDGGTMHYYMIGHPVNVNPDTKTYLWNWTGSGLQVHKLVSEETEEKDHGDLFGDTENRYQGRYDPYDKYVSIAVPASQRHREIPSALMNALEKKFSPKRIYVF